MVDLLIIVFLYKSNQNQTGYNNPIQLQGFEAQLILWVA